MKIISLKSNQSGLAHLLLIVGFVAVLAVIGGVGYRVYQTNQGETVSVVQEESIVDENDDADGEVLPPTDTSTDQVDVQAPVSTDASAN